MFVTIDFYNLYYSSTTAKPMKLPSTISVSHCEENGGIMDRVEAALLAVTGASPVPLRETANWQ